MSDDYTKEPLTIGELRSSKSHNSKDWTPREMLISTLRMIDAGEFKPDVCIIVLGTTVGDDGGETRVRLSTPNLYVSLGLLERANDIIQRDD